jgi:ADP-ribosylglycohydrolase
MSAEGDFAMDRNARAAVLASFAADSLALGVHWIYDAQRIATAFGRVETFLKPAEGSHHSTKDRGEFTHYGDQTLVLLESVAASGGFELKDFSERWQRLFENYTGYLDGATKGTLGNIARGMGPGDAGSASDDLAGAARIAPLLYRYQDDPDTLVRAARAQTAMTHTDPLTVDAGEFFARVGWKILQGASPVAALGEVAGEGFADAAMARWVQEGLESRHTDSGEAIGRFGQTCHTPEAFPGVIHLIAKYEGDLREALVQAVMAGGDSAARGMIVGMVLGAYLGEEALPGEWVSNLKRGRDIEALLDRFPQRG